MKLRPLVVVLAAFALAAACGCGKKGPKTVRVSGTVKFADGQAPQVPEDGIARVVFQPVSTGQPGAGQPASAQPTKTAYGNIGPDGRFEMTSFKPGDGVIPGRYKVLFEIATKYEDLETTSLIPAKYSNPDETPFEENIEKARTDLEYKLDRK